MRCAASITLRSGRKLIRSSSHFFNRNRIRCVPLETLKIVISLIGSTRTKEGLEVHAWLDENEYQKAKTVSNDQLSEVRIRRGRFHGEWNYQIMPNVL